MAEKIIKEVFAKIGVKINGNNPWDIQVHNKKFYSKVLSQGNLGLGESYMNKWWDCKAIDQLIDRILSADLDTKYTGKIMFKYLKSTLINQQTIKRIRGAVRSHYDIGNDLYKKMLDKRMIYSCAYWKNTKNLFQAQEKKLELICKKLQLKPGMKVLDIGCGWGGLIKYMVKKYKVKVVGLTISKEQAKYVRKSIKGLSVEVRLQDYRKINEKFDRIVSVGMIEHVGYKNYKKFMKVAYKNLKENGIFLLHTIGGNNSTKLTDAWIAKYIFPKSMIPSAKQLMIASEGLFVIEDWESFGTYYDKTLMAWNNNFNKNWDSLKNNYDQRFKRMWNYYLLSCAGSFRARKNQLWQIVFSKSGLREGYVRP